MDYKLTCDQKAIPTKSQPLCLPEVSSSTDHLPTESKPLCSPEMSTSTDHIPTIAVVSVLKNDVQQVQVKNDEVGTTGKELKPWYNKASHFGGLTCKKYDLVGMVRMYNAYLHELKYWFRILAQEYIEKSVKKNYSTYVAIW